MPISLPFTLPEGFSEAEFRALAPTDMWERDPQQAAILALRRSGTFDEAAYLEANPDVRENGMGAIEHYVKYGIVERRLLKSFIPVEEQEKYTSYKDAIKKIRHHYIKIITQKDILLQNAQNKLNEVNNELAILKKKNARLTQELISITKIKFF